MYRYGLLILVSTSAIIVYSTPTFPLPSMELFRGIPDEDGPVDPVVLRKWEEFRTNITNGRERSLFSCLEDQTYSAINDFANCHLFCPVCNWGYGKCDLAGGMRICICDCDFFSNLLLDIECPFVSQLCTRVAESVDQAQKLTRCQQECQSRGFNDGALCGADMEDPPLVKSTCTCLC